MEVEIFKFCVIEFLCQVNTYILIKVNYAFTGTLHESQEVNPSLDTEYYFSTIFFKPIINIIVNLNKCDRANV